MSEDLGTMKVIVFEDGQMQKRVRKIASIEMHPLYGKDYPVPELAANEAYVRMPNGQVYILTSAAGEVQNWEGMDGKIDMELMIDLAMSKPEFYGEEFKVKGRLQVTDLPELDDD